MNSESQDSVELSIVIPVFNAEKTISDLIESATEVLDQNGIDGEIVLVDDGSKDSSWKIMAELGKQNPETIQCIQLMRNYGQHNALMCGLRHSRGDVVITMDDDLQHPPSEIPKLLDEIHCKDVDVIYGTPKDKQHAAYRKLGSRIVNWFIRRVFNFPCNVSAFRVIRRPIVEGMLTYDLNFTFIDGLISWQTTRIDNCPVEHHAREKGRSGYGPIKLAILLTNIITNFRILPLRLVSLVGVGTALAGMLAAIYYIVLALLNQISVPGYASTIIAILIIGGVQLLSIGVLGEYLGRLHMNVNKRPQFKIRQVSGFSGERESKNPIRIRDPNEIS